MSDVRIVRHWDSMPPEVQGEGEVFSTRVLATKYRSMERALELFDSAMGSCGDNPVTDSELAAIRASVDRARKVLAEVRK